MSSLYEAVGTSSVGPQKVNFGWVSEAWSLFKANAGLWMSAVVLGVFGPILFNAFIVFLYRLTNHIAGLGSMHSLLTLPHGLVLGLAILTAIYSVFIASGMANMAVKAVSVKTLAFSDIYSGGPLFGRMLFFMVLYSVMISVGLGFVLLPGLFLAGLLLPAFALIAGGDSISKAMKRSFAAMKPDRAGAMGFVFVMGLLTVVSSLTIVGLLVTLPMAWLVSALAARDMVRLPALDAASDPYYNPLENSSWSSSGSAMPAGPFSYSQGERTASSDNKDGPRLSLTGAPLDENDNEAQPPTY